MPIKTLTQQVIATLHRLRSGWLADRVRSINTLRGLLRELGFFIPEGRKHVLPEAWEIIHDHHRGLPEALKPSLAALCHGARSILWHAKRMKHRDRLRSWALRLERKIGHNKAAAALANKLARITWAVWNNDRNFEPVFEPQAA